MEQLSSQDKKELFMSMVEKAKNGTLNMMRMTESKSYDEIYSQLENNYGPFGMVINGITRDGKISVYLAENLNKQLPSSMGVGNGSTIEFEESDLNDFLDRFYDMNNMEILNEFYKTAPEYFKNASMQEYKDEEYSDFFDRLVMLNGLDYLSQLGNSQIRTLGRNNYMSENGLQVSLMEEDGRHCICLGEGSDIVVYDTRAGKIKEKNFKSLQFEQYINTFLQSVEDLPRIYESIIKGTYKREDFIPTIEAHKKQSPLQQIEDTLATLEKEEKTILEAEALIDKQTEKQGQDIGE